MDIEWGEIPSHRLHVGDLVQLTLRNDAHIQAIVSDLGFPQPRECLMAPDLIVLDLGKFRIGVLLDEVQKIKRGYLKEPNYTAVVLDGKGIAWQRDGNTWYPATDATIAKPGNWLNLLARGPLEELTECGP